VSGVRKARRAGEFWGVWRNEANWARKWLSRNEERGLGERCIGGRFSALGWRLGGLGGRGGLEILKSFDGAEEHPVGGIDAAVEAGEGVEGILIGMAERGIVLDGGVDKIGVGKILVEAFDLVIPELRFDAAETALGPFGGDEGVDEGEFGGAGRLVVVVECGGEGFEFGGIFAGDDVGPGVDAGFQGVERRGGFAFGRRWAGGFLGVEAIGVDLGFSGHGESQLRASTGADGSAVDGSGCC